MEQVQEYKPYLNQHIRLNLNQYVDDLNKKNGTRITVHQFVKSRAEEVLIHRYELIRELKLNQNYSLASIGRLLGLNHATIINALNKYKGLKEHVETKKVTRRILNHKEIIQCDKEGNDIKTFSSQIQAVKELKCSQPNISKALKSGTTCGGFYFRYKGKSIATKTLVGNNSHIYGKILKSGSVGVKIGSGGYNHGSTSN